MKLILKPLILIFFINIFCYGQKSYTNKQIDSVFSYLNYNDIREEYTAINNMYKSSLQNKYREGECVSLICLSKINCDIGENLKALDYIDDAEVIASKMNNDSLIFYVNVQKAVQYGRIGLNENSLELINECISKISSIPKIHQNYYLGKLYTYKANFSGGLKKQPKQSDYIKFHHKALFYFKKVERKIYIPSYTNLGDTYYKSKKYKLALFYYKQALLCNRSINKDKSIEYSNLSEAYFEDKKYMLSLCYSDSALILSKKNKIYYLSESNYCLRKKIYDILNDKEQYLENLKLELEYKDSSNFFSKKQLISGLVNIVEKKDKKLKVSKKNLIYLSILVVLIFLVLFYQLKMKKKLKNESKQNINKLLVTEENVIHLKKKVSVSYDEIIVKAKKNDPLFVVLFKELYPEFYANLIKIQPGLTITEQKICFYLKLKFSTKEIAEYTFVTVKAIQNRKNRLRKRFFLEEGQDIYKWLDDLS